MTMTSRVIWQEGMFLRAQHFQQQDRWADAAMRARVAALGPHFWGFGELEVTRADGEIRVTRASGVFMDGTPFSFPGANADAEAPLPLPLTDKVRDKTVYLAVPAPNPDATQVSPTASIEERRLAESDFRVPDTHSGSPEDADLKVGRLRTKLLLGEDGLAGYQAIAVARVTEVTTDRRIELDEQFIPPVLFCHAAPPLARFIADLVGMINQRSEELAGRLTGGGTRGAAEQADFLLLQTANRWLPLLRHWMAAAVLHPEHLYESLIQIAGELATFSAETMRASSYPAYRHDDLKATFAPVRADLGRSLAMVTGPGVTEIKLTEMKYGVRRGALVDRTVLQGHVFYLVVRAAVPSEALRRAFPALVKIGAIEQIRELVSAAVSGIEARPLPVAPRQLPFIADANYFMLDPRSPHWAQMQNSAAFGIHIQNEPPSMQIQLYAVRS